MTGADRPGWRVLLLGGNSGAGKTTVARALRQQLDVSSLMVDDVRIALQAATTPHTHPDLHAFLTYQPEQWMQPDRIVADWLRVGQALIQPLRDIVAHHALTEDAGRLIVEGDGILPQLADPSTFADIAPISQRDMATIVRPVFLVEIDEFHLLSQLRARQLRRRGQADVNLAVFARASCQFGRIVAQAARERGQAVVPIRPKATVIDRVLAEIR